jgi:hypothetical protein
VWLGDIVAETIIWWSVEPDGPAAKLAPGFIWFALSPGRAHHWEDRRKLPFAPTFKDPRPRRSVPVDTSGIAAKPTPEAVQLALRAVARAFEKQESIEQFSRRMKKEFNDQLNAYVRMLRDRRSQARVHAEWTVLKFSGKSIRQIADMELPPRRAPHEDAEEAVKKAVHRFAERIGLTLPHKENRQPRPRPLARSAGAG